MQDVLEPPNALLVSTPARATLDADTPWIPLGPGRAMKPIRFLKDDRGYVSLMRVDPGAAIPKHRHSGEIHAMNLSGRRRLHTGEIIGPGDYVYEPPGNIDAWEAVGDEPAIVLIFVRGCTEYLGPDGEVTARFSAVTQEAVYRRYCEGEGLQPLDLTE